MLDTGWIVSIVLGVLLLISVIILIICVKKCMVGIMGSAEPNLDNRDCDLNSKYDHSRWNALIASIEKDTNWNPANLEVDNAL